MLETREIKITLTDEVWKLLEEKAKRENDDLESWIKWLLITEAVQLKRKDQELYILGLLIIISLLSLFQVHE